MTDNSISFIKVTTEKIIEFINDGKERIIFVKPAFLKKEIEALLCVSQKKNIKGTVFTETGDTSIRYGFGEKEALKLLSENSNNIEVHLTSRIRIAILIVDDKAIVYMPNLTFIEEESQELAFPNGFVCSKEVTEDIVKQFEFNRDTREEIEKVDNIFIHPKGYIEYLDPEQINEELSKAIKKLENSPVIDPSKLSKVNFYRNNYKILKMQVCGIRINRKSINLKPFYSLLPQGNERLKSSWNIFTQEDINELQDTKLFEIELDKIQHEFRENLWDAGRFGSIININKKKEYSNALDKLKEDFKKYLSKNSSPEVIKRFEGEVSSKDNNIKKIGLEEILLNSRDQLEKYLLKLCPTNKEFFDIVFKEYRHLKNSKLSNAEILEEFIKLFVSNNLKFTELEDIIKKIDIKCDWYDISDELLFDNKDFQKIIEQYKLDFRENSVGYEQKSII